MLLGIDLDSFVCDRTKWLWIWVAVRLISVFGSIAFYPTFRLPIRCFGFVFLLSFWWFDWIFSGGFQYVVSRCIWFRLLQRLLMSLSIVILWFWFIVSISNLLERSCPDYNSRVVVADKNLFLISKMLLSYRRNNNWFSEGSVWKEGIELAIWICLRNDENLLIKLMSLEWRVWILPNPSCLGI